jgi:hypothetical protein
VLAEPGSIYYECQACHGVQMREDEIKYHIHEPNHIRRLRKAVRKELEVRKREVDAGRTEKVAELVAEVDEQLQRSQSDWNASSQLFSKLKWKRLNGEMGSPFLQPKTRGVFLRG